MKSLMLFALLLPICSCSGQAEQSFDHAKWQPQDEKRVDNLVNAYTDLDIFSGVVTIAIDGKPVYNKAFGLADRRENRPNNTQTCFDIGSMNKDFTKVVILKLARAGKLKLDDPIGKYLKGFPAEVANNVTIRHLLNHESGYGDYHSPDYFEAPMNEKTIAAKLDRIRKLPLLFEPGTEQEYSNSGYVLLGAIIEAVTGASYFDEVEKRIVKPLGLKHTYLRDKYSVPNRAIGYYKNMTGEIQSNEGFQELPSPDGGFYSNTTDMLQFYRAFYYGDDLWDDATRELNDMYPFYQQHMTTGGAMTHAGGFEGANTAHFEILRDRISILVFANMDEPVAENVAGGILDIVRDKEPKKPTLPAIQAIYKTFTEQGSGYVRNNFESLSENFHPSDPKDLILNQIGYEFLFDGQTEKALEAFRINTELFPGVANVWDSYGEALLQKGDSVGALKAYQKALEIDPRFPTALEAVERLKKE